MLFTTGCSHGLTIVFLFLSTDIVTKTSNTHLCTVFLLLARYVPNVAKRSIWDQCKKYNIEDRPATDDPPTDRRPTYQFWRFQMAISPRGVVDPLHVWFYLGFSGSADWMALFPVWPNPRWRPSRHLGKFKLRYLRDGSSDWLAVIGSWVGCSGVGGSNGAISSWTNFSKYVGDWIGLSRV